MAKPATDGDFVLVADNDAAFRAFARDLLRRAGWSSDEAEDGEAALELAARRRPALVLLDVCLPRVSGYEVCRELRDRFGEGLPIVFVSGERTASIDRVSGLLIGADDYLVKPLDPDELLARVRTLLRRTQMPGGNHRRAPGDARPDPRLTPRELEVLRFLAEGLSQAEIARRLVISTRTVGTHIQHVLAKLDVHSRTQAVAIALRSGLVEAAGGGAAP